MIPAQVLFFYLLRGKMKYVLSSKEARFYGMG